MRGRKHLRFTSVLLRREGDLRPKRAHRVLLAALAGTLIGSTAPAATIAGRVAADRKGSALLFPAVTLRWDDTHRLVQDVFIELSNDYPENVWVQIYYVNGDAPLPAVHQGNDGHSPVLERAHPGWNDLGVQIELTADEPTYWSVATGQPKGLSSFAVLDPGNPPGRPAPEGNGSRMLRGFIVLWAVSASGEEVRWNHLSGRALTVNYADGNAWEYLPWTFQSAGGDHGTPPASCLVQNLESGRCAQEDVLPGRLDLDGFEYDSCPSALMFNFHAAGSWLPDVPQGFEGGPVNTALALLPCDLDVRQDNEGPITTKAAFDIWNQNEFRFSGTDHCITCWDFTLLGHYAPPNHFLVYNLQTDRGKARVRGMGSTVCDNDEVVSVDAGLLGVAIRLIDLPSGVAASGSNLSVQGMMPGRVYFDVSEPPGERDDEDQ